MEEYRQGLGSLDRGSDLLSIFFSEFDNVAGPKITFQVPEGFINSEVFEAIHEYIITKPNLRGKLITLKAFKFKIIGNPSCLEHQKYQRNALFFNVCFVLAENCNASPYEPIVQKVNSMLRTLEHESEFIYNATSKMRIHSIIKDIFYSLNRDRECSIPIDDANTLYLKLFPGFSSPPAVMEHHVPVFVKELDNVDIKDWDLALQQVIPYIDGVNYVKRISQFSGIDLEVVKRCIQHLLYYKYAVLKDIFQYSNIYATTPKIHNLVDDGDMQQECLWFITRKGMQPPPIEKVFSLYCSLKPGISVRDFCIENDTYSLNIDDRQFITFGVLNGLIRRIHQYPISLKSMQARKEAPDVSAMRLQQVLNNGQTFDLICCNLSKGHEEITTLFQADKEITILYK
eukprot:TRINITY_DN7662_c0_g1_i1.p2 TRINITY_DN7662_c0_g1~~TRINITY_DN7662_c0_g1_i1.p2  ORF type:complete len:400 (+),score=91.55 TRINITY_DN7662_c0_g1_i1:37-1236(+)